MSSRTLGEMVDAGEPVCSVFAAILDLHRALKADPVKDRLWRHAWVHAGRDFALVVNGHLQLPIQNIPPLCCMVEVDDWPRVMTGMFDGTVIGGPDTEDFVIAGIRAEIARVAAESAQCEEGR